MECTKFTAILQMITHQLEFWQLLKAQQNWQSPRKHSQQWKTANTMQAPAAYRTHHSIDPVSHHYSVYSTLVQDKLQKIFAISYYL